MARLSLSLLGPFRAELDGVLVTAFKSNKVRALLAYLAVESNRSHYRDGLAGLLWPELPDDVALADLRDALSNLRLLLHDRDAASPFVLVGQGTLQFNSESDFWLDVTDFSQLVSRSADIDCLERAVARYRGSFLEGFSLSDSPAFEEWLLLKHEQFRRQMTVALCGLAAYYQGCGKYPQAQAHCRSWLELDPYDEEAQRMLMHAMALDGRRNAALAQYQAYRHLLAVELGVEPEVETTALYQLIRDGTIHKA